MRGLIKLGLLAGLGVFAYNSYTQAAQARTKDDRGPTGSSGVVRNAGPEEQVGIANDDWDVVDQQVDESFPASDPPANY